MKKSSTKRFFSFTKIEHTVFSLPLIFAGAWLGAGGRLPSLRTVALIVMAGVGARILGMSMNRILDRRIDAKNPRTRNRELVTGAISLPFAIGIAAAGLVVYEAACLMLGPLVFYLSPAPAVALITYSLLKRFTPLCHFGIGLVMALAPAGAYVAVSGRFDPGPTILLLTGFAFFWMSGFDIIYAIMDISFDRKHRVRSIPAALGSTGAQVVAALCHLAALAALVALVTILGGSPFAMVLLGVSATGFVCAYLPAIPLPTRFFPISAIAGISGAVVPFF
jgi:4-hydroxybenzoate polyprenyltransferase